MKSLLSCFLMGLLTACATCPSSSYWVKPESDYHGCNFTSKSFKDADFSNTNLNGALFRETDLSGSNFSGANISNADFRYANLQNTNFLGAWAGRKMGDYVYDNIGFLTYQANLTGATWVNGKICGANSITTCK